MTKRKKYPNTATTRCCVICRNGLSLSKKVVYNEYIMGIINSILRSKDDLVKPKKKSYWNFQIKVEIIDINSITDRTKKSPSEKRLLLYELSGKEPVEQVILLKNEHVSLGNFTTLQVKDMLDDLGFNVDTILAGRHESDFSAVMNTHGYLIPGWEKIIVKISEKFPILEKLLLFKLAPGKERLHIRAFELNNGSWAFVAHTECNWMNPNLVKVFKAHGIRGSGNYAMGTLMLYELLLAFAKNLKKNQILPNSEIINITQWAYYQSMADEIKDDCI